MLVLGDVWSENLLGIWNSESRETNSGIDDSWGLYVKTLQKLKDQKWKKKSLNITKIYIKQKIKVK